MISALTENINQMDKKQTPTPQNYFNESAKKEEDAEERLARGRERNREHARKTRLRKKAQLENLQAKMMELQAESQVLKQSLEECSIASILLGLSEGDASNLATKHRERSLSECSSIISSQPISVPTSIKGRRKRFISDISGNEEKSAQFKFQIRGVSAVIGGGCSTHINWKTGVYCDEHGDQKQLTTEELEKLRRERNRMHAKMTRDRKKSFITCVEKTIAQLEKDNQKMRDTLKFQVQQCETTSSPVSEYESIHTAGTTVETSHIANQSLFNKNESQSSFALITVEKSSENNAATINSKRLKLLA